MSLLMGHRASDELDEAAVAEKKTLGTDSSDLFVQPHRSGVMTTPRTRTDSATGMTSFPSVSDTPPPGIRSLLLVPVQISSVLSVFNFSRLAGIQAHVSKAAVKSSRHMQR